MNASILYLINFLNTAKKCCNVQNYYLISFSFIVSKFMSNNMQSFITTAIPHLTNSGLQSLMNKGIYIYIYDSTMVKKQLFCNIEYMGH